MKEYIQMSGRATNKYTKIHDRLFGKHLNAAVFHDLLKNEFKDLCKNGYTDGRWFTLVFEYEKQRRDNKKKRIESGDLFTFQELDFMDIVVDAENNIYIKTSESELVSHSIFGVQTIVDDRLNSWRFFFPLPKSQYYFMAIAGTPVLLYHNTLLKVVPIPEDKLSDKDDLEKITDYISRRTIEGRNRQIDDGEQTSCYGTELKVSNGELCFSTQYRTYWYSPSWAQRQDYHDMPTCDSSRWCKFRHPKFMTRVTMVDLGWRIMPVLIDHLNEVKEIPIA